MIIAWVPTSAMNRKPLLQTAIYNQSKNNINVFKFHEVTREWNNQSKLKTKWQTYQTEDDAINHKRTKKTWNSQYTIMKWMKQSRKKERKNTIWPMSSQKPSNMMNNNQSKQDED